MIAALLLILVCRSNPEGIYKAEAGNACFKSSITTLPAFCQVPAPFHFHTLESPEIPPLGGGGEHAKLHLKTKALASLILLPGFFLCRINCCPWLY